MRYQPCEMANSATAQRKHGRVPLPGERPARIQIEGPQPVIDGGRYRAKACEGDDVEVGATIFLDGHDELRACVRHRRAGDRSWHTQPLERVDPALGVDRFAGSFAVDGIGRWQFQIEAFIDRFATWRGELERKLAAGETELAPELEEGAAILLAAREHARGGDATLIATAAAALADGARKIPERCAAALEPALAAATSRRSEGASRERSKVFELDVERRLARDGAWYELFPRSWGGFEGVRTRLPQLAELGFDVLYLPPIHPIGADQPQGPQQRAQRRARRSRVSPWAIGDRERRARRRSTPTSARSTTFDALDRRGARARHRDRARLRDPVLGRPSLADRASRVVSPPPRRHAQVRREPAQALPGHLQRQLRLRRTGARSGTRCCEVVLHWVDCGVTVFRVDNPHTKPLAVLGVADRARCTRVDPDVRLPGRGVHARAR